MGNRKFNAIIVDDERLARNALKSLLEEEEEVEIIGEADNIKSAAILIEKTDPDVVFLDIQMQGESGFDLLDKIPAKVKIIFVTAFDEYALRAFEVNALDYLMKPVTPVRLRSCIERLFEEKPQGETEKKKLTASDRLFILFNTHYLFLKVEAILFISAAGDYSELHLTDGKKGLTNKTLLEWESRLPDNTFCRIHRSTIINMDHVVKVDEWFNNAFRLQLRGVEEPFTMSRRYSSSIKNKLS